MKLTKFFNINRFLLLCRHNILLNYKKYFSFAVVYSLIVYVVLLLTIIGMPSGVEGIPYVWLFLILMVLGFLIPAVAFSETENKSLLSSYLLQPASHFEKYLVKLITNVIIVLPFLIIMFWIDANFARWTVIFLDIKPPIEIDVFTIRTDTMWPVKKDTGSYDFLLFVISIMTWAFAGSFFFNKYKVLKTLIALGGVCFVDWLLRLAYSQIFSNGLNGFGHGLNKYKTYLDLYNTQWHLYIIGVSGIVLLLLIGYHKLKEKEV